MTDLSLGQGVGSQLGGLYETEVQRLQREADEYTKKLEHERKSYLLLEDQQKQLKVQLNNIYGDIKKKIPGEDEEKRKIVARLSGHHQLEHEKEKLNDTIGENNKLKTEIQIMRGEILFAQYSIKKMSTQIQKYKDVALTAAVESQVTSAEAREVNNKILALKDKSEEDKEQFEHQLSNLQEKLKERDDTDDLDDNQGGDREKKGKPGEKKDEFYNPIEILKIRLRNIVAKNKEKKRMIEQYMRNAQVIEAAFETMKQGSGITNIEEIVTTFIKSEEQNYSLFSYVDLMGQECDILEDSNARLDAKIQQYEDLAQLNAKQLSTCVSQMRDKAEDQRTKIQDSQTECDDVLGEYNQIQVMVKEMCELFAEARFSTRVANNMQYDEHTNFNENNITTYLSELEEYLASLITYQAYAQGDPNAAISSVPLEYLEEKHHGRNDQGIEMPGDASTVAELDDEKETVGAAPNIRQTYMKALDLIEAGNLVVQERKDMAGKNTGGMISPRSPNPENI